MTIYNKNRVSTLTLDSLVSMDATVADEGTRIYSAPMGAAFVPGANGLNHFGLNPATYYAIRVSNESTSTEWITFDLKFIDGDVW